MGERDKPRSTLSRVKPVKQLLMVIPLALPRMVPHTLQSPLPKGSPGRETSESRCDALLGLLLRIVTS